MKIRLHGTADEIREALELLESVMLIQSVRGPYQDRQRNDMERSVLVRVYVEAIPRGWAMTTLISYQSSGGDQGRCDAKCYDATEPDCDCICGGRNHGAGKQQAIENTRELAQSWIEAARVNGQDVSHVELLVDVQHQPLFDLGGVR